MERIDGRLPPLAPLRPTAPPQPAKASELRTETAKLHTLARELATLPPPVDEARVAELRVAIASGRYHLDPAAIAAAMRGRDD